MLVLPQPAFAALVSAAVFCFSRLEKLLRDVAVAHLELHEIPQQDLELLALVRTKPVACHFHWPETDGAVVVCYLLRVWGW